MELVVVLVSNLFVTAVVDSFRETMIGWAAMTAVTLLYPPVFGWLRPHRHSDNAGNRGGFGGLKE